MILRSRNKSVRDNTQAVMFNTDSGKIKVTSYFGKKVVYAYWFNVRDYFNYKPTMNEDYNNKEFIEKIPENKDDSEFNPFRARLLDAQRYAINSVIKEWGGK